MERWQFLDVSNSTEFHQLVADVGKRESNYSLIEQNLSNDLSKNIQKIHFCLIKLQVKVTHLYQSPLIDRFICLRLNFVFSDGFWFQCQVKEGEYASEYPVDHYCVYCGVNYKQGKLVVTWKWEVLLDWFSFFLRFSLIPGVMKVPKSSKSQNSPQTLIIFNFEWCGRV